MIATGGVMEGRSYPADEHAERCLLGGLMLAPDQIAEVSATLRGEDFYLPSHQALYELLQSMHAARS